MGRIFEPVFKIANSEYQSSVSILAVKTQANARASAAGGTPRPGSEPR